MAAHRSRYQAVKDFFLAPFRLLLLPDDMATKLGLTSLEEERIRAVLPHIKGRLLDIGAGRNRLVKAYGNGIGIDVYDWGGGALIVEDSSNLPFADKSFDTITFLACLNHIPYKEAVLKEAYRLLQNDGHLIITMINPLLGWIGHKIFWWYSEEKERGIESGEIYGLWPSQIKRLCEQSGFHIVLHQRFVYSLNHLFVMEKAR